MKAEFSEIKKIQRGDTTQKIIKRGDIFMADLGTTVGSEQGGYRPVIVIQNNIGNKYSPTVIVASITSQINKAKLPTHVELSKEYGLEKDSVVLLEQIRTLDKRRLKEKVTTVSEKNICEIDKALKISISKEIDIVDKELELIKKNIGVKVESVKILDIVIYHHLEKGRDISLIQEDMIERKERILELEAYCKEHGQDIKNYYDVNCIKNNINHTRMAV